MSGTIIIQPKRMTGTLAVPPSKSVAHRAIIAASLARSRSMVGNIELSQDIEATLGAMSALGASIALKQMANGRMEAYISGAIRRAEMPVIDCRESGSTLRFMLPVALVRAGGAVFTGSARLGQRNLEPYLKLFGEQGIAVEQGSGGFPLTVKGALAAGRFTVPGNISSQFITGLMLAAPLLGGQSEIAVEGELESLLYVDITIDVLQRFGVAVQEVERGRLYRVEAGQAYQSGYLDVEGDWSQAAFPLLMGLIGGPVAVAGLNPRSRQGDRAIEDIFRSMGGELEWSGGVLLAKPSRLASCTMDVSQCPDLTPAIAAAMAVAEGKSCIVGGKRLRDKESDRLHAIASCLNALGSDVQETEDGLVIRGKDRLQGGNITSFNDHRIAMMAAGVSPLCAEPVIVQGYEAVAKSWPGFWQDFKDLGGDIHEQPMG